MRLRCRDEGLCPCLSHVDTQTHLPVCVACYHPLGQYTPRRLAHDASDLSTEADVGMCVNDRCQLRGKRVRPVEFTWKERGDYSADDLPPYSGYLPIELGALQ